MSIIIPEDLKGYLFDATPSWNGYNHQGKVALYTTIKMINELKLSRDDCKEYELELDLLEDFSILISGEYKYAHQVKTYKEKTINKYSDAVWTLLAKAEVMPTIQNIYLHTTQPVTNFKQIKDEITEPTEPKKVVEDDTEKSKQKINRTVFKTPRQCYELIKGLNNYDELWDKFSFYLYEQNHYCELDNLKDIILKEINNFEVDFAQHSERVYSMLLKLIDNNVLKRHIQVQSKSQENVIRINFQDIYNLLYVNHEQSSKEYCISHLKERFNDTFLEFIDELDELELEESEDIRKKEHSLYRKNLNFLSKYVMLLNDNEFLDFCMIIAPHQIIDQTNHLRLDSMLNQLCTQVEIKNGYLTILDKIEDIICKDSYSFSKNNKSFLPTIIIDDDYRPRVDTLIKKMLENSLLNDVILNEVDFIINKNINRSNLKSGKITQEELNDDKRKYEKFMYIKDIKMIDINKAAEEFYN